MAGEKLELQLSRHSNIIYKVNIISELEPHTYSVVTNTCICNICYQNVLFLQYSTQIKFIAPGICGFCWLFWETLGMYSVF